MDSIDPMDSTGYSWEDERVLKAGAGSRRYRLGIRKLSFKKLRLKHLKFGNFVLFKFFEVMVGWRLLALLAGDRCPKPINESSLLAPPKPH